MLDWLLSAEAVKRPIVSLEKTLLSTTAVKMDEPVDCRSSAEEAAAAVSVKVLRFTMKRAVAVSAVAKKEPSWLFWKVFERISALLWDSVWKVIKRLSSPKFPKALF